MDAYIPGGGVDALPTLGMARCLEEEFQECENSHAAHLAYGDFEPRDASLASLLGPLGSERRVAGPVMDFVRNNLRIASFDHRQQAEQGAGSREQGAGSRKQSTLTPGPSPATNVPSVPGEGSRS